MDKVAVVTGGSSGMGKYAAEYLSKMGCTVYELSRRGTDCGSVRHITADVTDEESVNMAVTQVIREAGHIDILLNNAGFGISGAVEYTPLEEAKKQLDVNFWGMVRVTRAVIPYMRSRGSGRIVNTSSVAGEVPIPFQTYYSVSKAAINSFTMALNNELRPFGITVCAVMPGDTCTGFTEARTRRWDGDEEYAGRISRSVDRMERDERRGASARAAGEYLGKTALSTGGKVFHTIGLAYKLVVFLMRLLPSTWADRLLFSLYAK